ncbi:MAG: sulfotransferase domain-containing protein, partial [Geitlerinemataceae cyanobacterium]
MLKKASLQILDIIRVASTPSGSIYAYNLDRPKKGEYYNDNNFKLAGWVLSKKSPIVALEFISNDRVLQTTALNHPRPDVITAYPDVSVSNDHVGFSTTIDMSSICEAGGSQLFIQAVFEDESRETLSKISFNCQTLEYNSIEKLGPDFIIIGAMKAATSAIYDYLSHHPRVLRRYPKELHFFTLHFHQGLDWYLSQFSPIRTNQKGQPLLTGEASPTYLVDAEAPKRIHSLFPKAKFIVSLRNPTDRAISHYYHQVKRVQNEKRSLEEAFSETELANLQEKPFSATRHYIQNGLYAQHLKNWFEVFPREKILVLNYHDLETNPDRFVAEVFEFLNLQDYS